MICSECEWNIVKSRVHDKGYEGTVKNLAQVLKKAEG